MAHLTHLSRFLFIILALESCSEAAYNVVDSGAKPDGTTESTDYNVVDYGANPDGTTESIDYNVVDYGAKPDGTTDSTDAFKKAWDAACHSTKQATIYVPKGSFLVSPIKFKGPCKTGPLHINIDGTIVAPEYRVLKKAKNWIEFIQISGIIIEGGILDGRGKSLWHCKKSGKSCPLGAISLQFSKCQNVNITGLTSKDSKFFHMLLYNCTHVMVQKVTITAPKSSPNTDGIHVALSNDVHISDSNIRTGDDCISIAEGTSSLWIENINCGPGHGISIGSLGKQPQEAGVENVTVTNCRFTDTENGVRIKTYPSPCTSFVKQVTFQHATMNKVENPIVIDQHYCNGGAGKCIGPDSGLKISNISYIDIRGTCAKQYGVSFNCSQKNPCSGLYMENINLDGKASCVNAYGTTSGAITPSSCLAEYD